MCFALMSCSPTARNRCIPALGEKGEATSCHCRAILGLPADASGIAGKRSRRHHRVPGSLRPVHPSKGGLKTCDAETELQDKVLLRSCFVQESGVSPMQVTCFRVSLPFRLNAELRVLAGHGYALLGIMQDQHRFTSYSALEDRNNARTVNDIGYCSMVALCRHASLGAAVAQCRAQRCFGPAWEPCRIPEAAS